MPEMKEGCVKACPRAYSPGIHIGSPGDRDNDISGGEQSASTRREGSHRFRGQCFR